MVLIMHIPVITVLFKIVDEIDKEDEKQYNDKDIEVEITLSTSINQSQLIRKHGLMEIQ